MHLHYTFCICIWKPIWNNSSSSPPNKMVQWQIDIFYEEILAWHQHQGGEHERPWRINGQLGRDIGVIRALALAAAIASTKNCSQARSWQSIGRSWYRADTDIRAISAWLYSLECLAEQDNQFGVRWREWKTLVLHSYCIFSHPFLAAPCHGGKPTT